MRFSRRASSRGAGTACCAGDVANLDGRGSVFPVESVDAELEARCARLDIHPTRAAAGRRPLAGPGSVLALEESTAARFPEALEVIRAERMNAERRPMRMRVRDLEYEYDADVLRLRFALDAGSFATTMLREIIVDHDGE